ncbi:ECs1072 family phage-associated protein [Phytobacter sp. V91]|uniref:ECs1072 family phage-associated protein n=1 Tax=Phytobacter sp. V91 TaxID=3369425 RepID=UPI003F610C2C
MQKFDDLWHAIEVRVCENNDITHQDMTNEDSVRGNAAKQRIAHIFILEVLLSRHREKYASPYLSLSGEEALYHLIFKRTGWKPFEVKQLSFSDAMFVIAELFREENLPADVRGVLRAYGLRDQPYSLYDFSEKDWAPRDNENILKR